MCETRAVLTVGLFLSAFFAGCSAASRADGGTDAGRDADASSDVGPDGDADDEPLPETCPEDMVEVPDRRFCIDRYEAGIDGSGAAVSVAGALPADEVSWEQAARACESAGKVLCPREVWLAACSAGGTRERPYGDTYDPTACNGGDDGFDLLPAGSSEGCEGGLDGLFDMTGNVWEWVAPCEDQGWLDCAAMGCDWDCRADNMLCETDVSRPNGQPIQGSGFRCCLELAG